MVNRNLDWATFEAHLKLVAGSHWAEGVTTKATLAVTVTSIQLDIRPSLTDIRVGFTINSEPGAFGSLERELVGKPIIA